MPIWFSTGPDYQLLRKCKEEVRATMNQTKWNGSGRKFDEVLNRRAWKLYSQAVNR